MRAALTIIVIKPCRRQRNATVKAVRHPPGLALVSSTRDSSRGKKIRKRSSLEQYISYAVNITMGYKETHIIAKQNH